MKLIKDSKYYNLKRKSSGHSILILNDELLLKPISYENIGFIKSLKKLKIDKVSLPIDIYRTIVNGDYSYSVENFKDSKTVDYFSTFEKKYSDKEILKFFRDLLLSVEKMHKSGLFSGDIWSDNILIDENLDYMFIDFDYASTKEYLGYMAMRSQALFLDNYNKKILDSYFSLEEQVKLSDKLNLWNMILDCMLTGNFSSERNLDVIDDIDRLELPPLAYKQLAPVFNLEEFIHDDDYMLESMDELIKTDYKLPYRKKK